MFYKMDKSVLKDIYVILIAFSTFKYNFMKKIFNLFFALLFVGFSFGQDVTPLSLITPSSASSICPNTTTTVVVRIKNVGGSTINFATNNLTVTATTAGASALSLSGTVITGTLLNNSTLNVTLGPIADLSAAGSHDFTLTTILTGDVVPGNDVTTESINVTKPNINPKLITTCAAFTFTPVDVTDGTVPTNTVYNWSAPSVTGVTGIVSGTDATSIDGNLINTTATSKNIIYSVTPSYPLVPSGSCVGDPFNVTVTLNPKATIANKTDISCTGVAFTKTISNTLPDLVPAGTTYSWGLPVVTGGMTGGATGAAELTVNGTLTNATSAAHIATYTVSPTSGSCPGSNFDVVVTVNPYPVIANTTSTTCTGVAFTNTPSNTLPDIVPAGTTYSWGSPVVTGGMTGGAIGTAQASIGGTLVNTTNVLQTATYTVTPTFGSCSGASFDVVVTVNPKATIANKTDNACTGVAFTNTPSNTLPDVVPAGTTYSWGLPVVTGGMTGGATGTAELTVNGTLTNATSSAHTATYTVSPTSGSCPGVDFDVIVTVNPYPVIANTTSTTCTGVAFTNTPSNTLPDVVPAGTTYSWGLPVVTGGMTGGAIGAAQASIGGTLVNTTNTLQTATYTVTPTFGSCSGASFDVVVTVNPKATIANTTSTTCTGVAFTNTPSNTLPDVVPAGTTYSWGLPVVTGGVTGGAIGTAQASIGGTLVNTTNASQTATYTVTPTSGTCSGASFDVVVTVNPKATIANKTDNSCTGVAFTNTPSNTLPDVVPAGTTYSWGLPVVTGGMTGGATGALELTVNGTLTNATSSAHTATYTVSPTSGSCPGVDFDVVVTVNPYPVIANTTSTSCTGVAFTNTPSNTLPDVVPTGTTYNWGLPVVTGGMTGGAIGTAQASIGGTLVNTTNALQTATYTVTPTFGSCSGASFDVVVTVNPYPVVANITDNTCSGIAFTNTPSNTLPDVIPVGTTYSWGLPVVTGGMTGGATGTAQASIGGTLVNTTNTAQTATYTVTPTSGTCSGANFDVVITVNKSATISNKTDNTCSGVAFTKTISNTLPDVVPTGTTYSWGLPVVTGGMTGGSIGTAQASIVGTLVNTTNVAQTATYTVTPINGTCTAASFDLIVTVNPIPTFSITGHNTTSCVLSDGAIDITGLTSNTNYIISYTNPTPSVITSGTINTVAGTTISGVSPLINLSAGNYTNITVQNATTSCVSLPQSVSLNPPGSPVITAKTDVHICAGTSYTLPSPTDPINGILGSNLSAGRNFYNLSGGPSTVGNTVINTAISTNTTVYLYDINAGCTDEKTFNVVIDPLPTASIVGTGSKTICSTVTATIALGEATASNGTISWSVLAPSIGTISAGSSTLTPTFTPGLGDAGQTVTLRMTVTSNNTCGAATATADYLVNVDALPTASAGGSQTICSNGTATVSGASASNGTISWTENGTGSILSGSSTLAPVYSATAGDVGIPVTLTLTVTSNNTCGAASVSANYTVNVDGLPTASITAPASQTICVNSNGTVSGAIATNGTVLWSENELGSIQLGTETTLAPVYNPSSFDAGKSIKLTMTVTSNNTCGIATSSADYTFIVQGLPTASLAAPASSTICSSGSATVSGATASNGLISWSENGAGTITSGGTTLTPVYAAAAGDAGNTVVLTMTVTSDGACALPVITTTKTYNVVVEALPTANVLGSSTICPTDNVTVAGASASNGTILWTHNGTGSFTLGTETTLTPKYNAAIGDAGNTVDLTMTVSSNNACNPATASDIYSITVNSVPNYTLGGTPPTTCASADAEINFTNLDPNTVFDISYKNPSLAVVNLVNQTSNGLGELDVTGLTSGSYTDVKVTSVATGCYKVDAAGVSLIAPSAIDITDIPNQTICSITTYILPTITAVNSDPLAPPYYSSALGGLGVVYAAGTAISTTQTIYMYGTNGGCSDQESFTVTVDPLPSASAGGSQSICTYGSATISGATASAGSILWTENGSGSIQSGTETTLTPIYNAAIGDAGNIVTLTMTVTSNNACALPVPATSSDTYTVDVIQLPTVTFTSTANTNNQTVCEGVAITPITYSVTGVGINPTVSALPAGITANFVPGTGVLTISGTADPGVSGNFYYVVTKLGQCGDANAIGTISINPSVSAASIVQPATICSGTSVVISGSVPTGGNGSYTYLWESSPSGLPGTFTSAIGVNAAMNYTTANLSAITYFRRTVSSGGCSLVSNIVTITTDASSPSIVLSSQPFTNNQNVCINTAITSIDYTLGGGATSATVSGLPLGLTSLTSAGGVFTISGTPLESGTFNYSVTTSGSSCGSSSLTGVLNVNSAIAVASISPLNSTICSGTSIILNGSIPSGGNGVYSYLWQSSSSATTGFVSADGLNSSVNYLTDNLNANTYYRCVITSGGCTDISAVASVMVDPANPTIVLTSPAFTNTQSVCNGSSITTISYMLGGGATNALVSGLPNTFTTSVTPAAPYIFTISGSSTVSGNYPFTITTAGSCGTASLTGIINVNDVITVAPLVSPIPSTICSGTSTILNGNIPTAGGNGTYSYTWLTSSTTGGPYLPATGINTTLNYSTPNLVADSYYVLSIASGSCSVQSTEIAITVDITTPTLTLNAPFLNAQNLCLGSVIGTPIAYTFGGNANNAIVTGLPTGVVGGIDLLTGFYTISGTPSDLGTFNYTVSTSGTCGIASATGTLTINDVIVQPLLTATPSTICEGTGTSITSSLPSGGNGTYTYSWYTSQNALGVSHSIAPGISSTLNYVTDTLNSNRYFTRIISSGGCIDSSEVLVTIEKLPIASITGSTGSTCYNATFTVPNTVATISNGAVYVWSENGAGAISAGANTLTPSYTPTIADAGKNVTLTLTLSSNNSCGLATDTATFVLSVNPLPEASLIGLTTSTICYSDSLYLNGLALNGTPSWTHNGTGVISNSSIVNPYYKPSIQDAGKTITLNFIVSDLTCITVLTDTAKYVLNIYALPTQSVNVGNDTTISLGSSVQLNAKGSSIVTWNWKPSISLDDQYIANPIASPLDTTTYTVIATHFNGCTSRDTIVVNVIKDHQLVISNMMSPNDDGKNDTWGIGNIENYPGTEVIVVNREGEIIFESQDYKNEWDGKCKGKLLPDATYYYIVKFVDSDKIYKGAITLLQGNK